ncbi:hypothetical protein B0J18DRAFT_462066 [Chaetomium sp. MPI-SDFR-AT-0129]|nr:hypothetical protein B0J18DRAFT_462066 [Chaetomium sp. MPI-SDFR-AT-0129]
MDATDESPGLFKIPRHIRENIYRLVFGSGPKHRSEYIGRMGPHVPINDLGLLSVSRMIHKEAIAILYESVDLGGDAKLALIYAQFILPKHWKRIRSVTAYYSCQGCYSRAGGRIHRSCNWHPVLKLLAASTAPISRVNIGFNTCTRARCSERRPPLNICRLKWEPEHGLFWAQLSVLSSADEICFIDPSPEYFVIRLARRLGWEMKGETGNGIYGCPISRFTGSLVSPELAAHRRRGLDVVRSSTGNSVRVGGTFPFLRLPIEIRRWIYKYAMEWEYRPFWPVAPATFNTGIGLLSTCREIAHEAKPFLYHSLTIYGGAPLRDLETFGSNITFTRRFNIQFSCFCTWRRHLEHQNHTASNEYRRKMAEPGHPHSVHETIEGEWTEALKRIQSLEADVELSVTFQSCCRIYRCLVDLRSVDVPDTPNHSSGCASLENHFTDVLLATCRHSSI